MAHAYLIGVGSTVFTMQPERSFQDLAREALVASCEDAGLDGKQLESVWFGNCAMHVFGQGNVRGQVVLAPLAREGLLDPRAPIVNVEGGCATGSMALRGACLEVLSGQAGVSLALGVEKTLVPDDPAKTLEVFTHGADRLHGQDWIEQVARLAAEEDLPFQPHPARVVFLDTYALQAHAHMKRFGTTREQLAAAASKTRRHGSLNPKAQRRKEISVEEVLADKPIVDPFTRAMCCPLSDGAAAAVVCSEDVLRSLPASARQRAIRVRASALASGNWRGLNADTVTRAAAKRAFAQAGLGPKDVDVVELHDSTSFCELQHLEQLGFCEDGAAGPWVAAGATAIGGELPVNPSGGLLSRGHPLAATGLGQIEELVTQLRGEAGPRQAGEPRVALQHNAGGLIGLDEAACAVHVLERAEA